MGKQHDYALTVEWTGNLGAGTSSYRSYTRDHEVTGENVAPIAGSADPAFRGDPTRWNPEQLLLASAAQCHMLSYLHHAATNNVVVTAYVDRPTAVLTQEGNGGSLTEIVLHPVVTVASEDQVAVAATLHAPANRDCFIANTLAVLVQHDARTVVQRAG